MTELAASPILSEQPYQDNSQSQRTSETKPTNVEPSKDSIEIEDARKSMKTHTREGVKQAFKIGFMKELVRQGISLDQLDSMIEKRAEGMGVLKALGGVGSAGLGLAGSLASGLGKGLLVGAPAVGALGGWLAGSQDNIDNEDIKQLENLSTIHEYEHALKQINKNKPVVKKRVQPVAGQSTQTVMQPELAKAASLPVQGPIVDRINKAKAVAAGKRPAPPLQGPAQQVMPGPPVPVIPPQGKG